MLGPKNIESKKNLGRKNILGQKKMLGPKNIESTKFWVWKKCWSEIFLDGNKFGVKKLWVKKCFVKKLFRYKKMFGQKPPFNSAKSSWVVYMPNLRLLVHPLLIDFGEGSSYCDRGETKSTPSSLGTWSRTGVWQ